jgi:hypothetical protein
VQAGLGGVENAAEAKGKKITDLKEKEILALWAGVKAGEKKRR